MERFKTLTVSVLSFLLSISQAYGAEVLFHDDFDVGVLSSD